MKTILQFTFRKHLMALLTILVMLGLQQEAKAQGNWVIENVTESYLEMSVTDAPVSCV
jgi:hypothetical protein